MDKNLYAEESLEKSTFIISFPPLTIKVHHTFLV